MTTLIRDETSLYYAKMRGVAKGVVALQDILDIVDIPEDPLEGTQKSFVVAAEAFVDSVAS